MEKEMNKHYLTNRESRAIEKENLRQMKMYEKKKKAKVPESEYISQMKREDTIIEIEDLHTYFFTDSGTVKAVNGVSFDIPEGSVVGVVGESGCGKSVTSLAIMRLVQGPQGQIVSGSIRFKSSDFVYDEKGKPVPVYERDEKGEIVYGPAPVRDKKGNIKTEPKQKTDLNGEPIFEEKNGKKVPVYETDEKGEIVRVPKVKRDKEGNPVSEPVQKCDERGFPVFETEPKVFDIAKMPMSEMRKLRGKEISMIFQDPMSSLNPIVKIGRQLTEAMLLKGKARQRESRKNFNETLKSLNAAMIQALAPNDSEKAAKLTQMCKDFDKFEFKHIELESAYAAAHEAAVEALDDLDVLIFELEKRADKDATDRVNDIATQAAASVNEYVVKEEAEQIKAKFAEVGATVEIK